MSCLGSINWFSISCHMRWKFHLYYVVTGETRAIPFLMYLWKLLQQISLVVAIGMTTSSKYKTNLKKGKSKSLFKLNEIKDDDDVMKGSFNGLRRGSSQTLKLGAYNVKSFFSEAANKMSLQLPTHKNLIQKLFPADFSSRPETVKHEDFNEGWCDVLCTVTNVLHVFQCGSKCISTCTSWRTRTWGSTTRVSRCTGQSSRTAATAASWGTGPAGQTCQRCLTMFGWNVKVHKQKLSRVFRMIIEKCERP